MKGSNAIMKMIANLRWLVLAALVVSCAGMAGDAQPQPKRPQGPAEKGPQNSAINSSDKQVTA